MSLESDKSSSKPRSPSPKRRISYEELKVVPFKNVLPIDEQIENFLINRGINIDYCTYNPDRGIITIVVRDNLDKKLVSSLLPGSGKYFQMPNERLRVQIRINSSE